MVTEILKKSLSTFKTLPETIYALFFFMILDYITGVCVAIKERKLSSKIGAKGIATKIMIVSLVTLSHILDTFLLNSNSSFTYLTILFYCSNELISIVENANRFGICLPQKLKTYIVSIKNKADKMS